MTLSFDPYPDPRSVTPQALRFAVSAIIRDSEGRILLQQRGDNGHWGLPGGGVEVGETVTEAIIREAREETGFEIAPGRLVGVYSDPQNHQIIHYPDGNIVHFVALCFEATVTGGAAQLCEETVALAWHHPDDLPEPLVPSHRLRVQDALARQPAAFIR